MVFWESMERPANRVIIIPLHKKGGKKERTNHNGISLFTLLGKMRMPSALNIGAAT